VINIGDKNRDFFRLLIAENEKQNLTAITDEDQASVLHFEDSLRVLQYIPQGAKSLIDVGTGAGFPGVPIAIMMPELSVTLLDAREKRVEFLRYAAQSLNLENTVCVHARAEEYARNNRELYDAAVARAVAGMRELCELCMPFVKAGGVFLAMKSQDTDEEIKGAENAIETLGGKIQSINDFQLSDHSKRRIIVIAKTGNTPEKYPRRYKLIQTKPL